MDKEVKQAFAEALREVMRIKGIEGAITDLLEKAAEVKLGERVKERLRKENPVYSRLINKLADEDIGKVTRILARTYGLDIAAYGYAILKGGI